MDKINKFSLCKFDVDTLRLRYNKKMQVDVLNLSFNHRLGLYIQAITCIFRKQNLDIYKAVESACYTPLSSHGSEHFLRLFLRSQNILKTFLFLRLCSYCCI